MATMKRILSAVIVLFVLATSSLAATEALQIDALWSGINNPTNGKSYSGAIVATFAADGSTAKAIWENKEKTQPSTLGKAQFTLDSNGQAEVFGDGVYVIKVYAPSDTGLTSPLMTFDGLQYIVTVDPSNEGYDSIADMRAGTGGGTDGFTKTLLGYLTPGDGGGGSFYWDETSVLTDDSGTIIKVTSILTGRWIRIYDGDIIASYFGAIGDGSNQTTAMVNLFAFINTSVGGSMYFPTGIYLFDPDSLELTLPKIRIYGDGRSTVFKCEPTTDGTVAIKWDPGVSTYIFQSSIKDISFYSDDTTYQKTFLELINISEFEIHGVRTASPNWLGNGSIGIHIRGRELTSIKDCKIRADRPILISPIPSGYIGEATSGFDQFHFQDLTLTANNYPNIEVETGVKLTNVTFDGYQSWNLGTYGFYFNDTTATVVGLSLTISNVRCEQGQDPTKQMVYIAHNTGLQGVTLRNVRGGDREGFYLRNCKQVTIDNCHYTSSTSGEALNVDSTVSDIAITNCFWQTSTTASITGHTLMFETSRFSASSPLAPTAFYASDTNPLTNFITGPLDTFGGISETPKTLADDATPSVAGGTLFLTGGTTTITDLDDFESGQLVTIVAEHTITITRGAAMRLSGGVDFVMDLYDTLTLRAIGNVWHEVGRGVNN